MYWDDFRKLIARNAASSTDIRYFYHPKLNPLKLGIFDRSIPHRKGLENFSGHEADDHWMNSHVCEAAFFNGEIPINSEFGDGKMHRGALDTLEIMLTEGCLRRSDELRRLYEDHGRRFPAPPA